MYVCIYVIYVCNVCMCMYKCVYIHTIRIGTCLASFAPAKSYSIVDPISVEEFMYVCM